MASDPLSTETKYIVPALAQGLGILSLFSGAQRSFTAPEIAKKLSLPRTKVFRLLQTLLSMDYLRCEEDKRHFSLGPALLSRGFEYLASLDMVEVAQPILQRLRDATGLSSHMAIRDKREIVYVARFPARSTIASSVNIGTRFPVHATVMGRMTIFDMDDKDLAALFRDRPLQRATVRSGCRAKPGQLRAEFIEQAREAPGRGVIGRADIRRPALGADDQIDRTILQMQPAAIGQQRDLRWAPHARRPGI